MANDGKTAATPEANYRPRFMEIPSFMRVPIVGDPAELDIALIGVPFDLSVTNRAGAPRAPRPAPGARHVELHAHHPSREPHQPG